MGNKPPPSAYQAMPENAPACIDDQSCKHVDEKHSTVDKMVYLCPGSKCVGGTCQCNGTCKRDPYSGSCCPSFQTINGTSYCSDKIIQKQGCKVPNQMIGTTVIPGQQICNWYTKYH